MNIAKLFFVVSDMKDRTFINSTAEKLCQKLEALDVSKISISPLKLLAVQVEVRISLNSRKTETK